MNVVLDLINKRESDLNSSMTVRVLGEYAFPLLSIYATLIHYINAWVTSELPGFNR